MLASRIPKEQLTMSKCNVNHFSFLTPQKIKLACLGRRRNYQAQNEGGQRGGWGGPTRSTKEKKISSQENSSLSRWIPSIAETFLFSFFGSGFCTGRRPLRLDLSKTQQLGRGCQALFVLGGPECSHHPSFATCQDDTRKLGVQPDRRGGNLQEHNFSVSLDLKKSHAPRPWETLQYFPVFSGSSFSISYLLLSFFKILFI